MRNKLVGILCILLAGLVLMQGYFAQWNLSIWMVLWLTLLGYLSLSNFFKLHFGWGFTYAILALFSLNGHYHFLPVSNSVVILSSILMVVGLNFLFKLSRRFKQYFDAANKGEFFTDDSHGNDVDISFSSVTKYLNDQAFTRGSADVSFGTATVYLDGCQMKEGTASYDIDISFGNLILYIPTDWRIKTNIDNSFSTINIRHNPSDVTSKDLYLTGDASFSTVTVKYVEP